ncbi:MAG: DPP IV N-terminal domain-containing protein [Tenuifilaceae bacterium]
MNRNRILLVSLCILSFAWNNAAFAQRGQGNDTQPQIIGWTDDNNYLIQTMDENKKPIVQSVNIKTGKAVVVPAQKSSRDKISEALPKEYKLSRTDLISTDGNSVLINKDNDLYYFTLGKSEVARLTKDSIPEMNARFSPDGKKIAYTKKNDLYYYDLAANKEIRLTHDATDKIYNGWASWVYMEEILGRASRYAAFWWSPDGNKIAYLRTDDTPVPVFTLNRLDEADGIHGLLEVTPYPKPGDPNPKVKMGIADLATTQTMWVLTDYSIDQYTAWPFWTPDSKRLAIQVLNRDQNDMKIILADPTTGDYTQIYNETRKTWIDFYEDIYVLKNGKGFILRSYRNDWENLYYHAWDGRLIAQITNFNWRVNGIEQVDEEKGLVYFTGTGTESTDNHYFRVGIDGKNLIQITNGNGSHRVSMSPKGNYFIDTWNSVVSAGSIIALDKKAKVIREIYKNEQPTFDVTKHSRSELVKITTQDGLFNMPALVTYPVNFDESKKYPVVFAIYGGPNAGTVSNRWGGTTPSWYSQNDIIVFSVDHRGSGHFGKKGLDYIHRCLGKWEILDYIDAVKWLTSKQFVDSTKIGITGGSYGGYMACLALTKGAKYWTHGVASSSVTDWKLYDNVYTERYMDTPQDNPEGYKDGSTLTFVNNFKGKLLITHGDMDDNVHMQNSIWLISKLQDANKTFEFMIYPNGRHGWGGAKRTHSTNESRRFWLQYFFGK